MPHAIEVAAACIFSLALIHTFAGKRIEALATRYPAHAGLFHFLGEVEVVFGFWALVLCAVIWAVSGKAAVVDYLEAREFTEPAFVFVVMVIAASKPVLQAVTRLLLGVAKILPLRAELVIVWLSLGVVPLLGSFITEPAAMTLAALLLRDRLFLLPVRESSKYSALAVLFVNVSIGGTLTAYAAPPVLMVASAWGWNTAFMAATFGWKAAIAVVINATVLLIAIARQIPGGDSPSPESPEDEPIPVGVTLAHLFFLVFVVLNAHHAILFVAAFLFFLGFTQAYERYQSPLLLRESLLVAFFLSGLVVLGGLQQWWLQPVVRSMDAQVLYIGATGLTAIMDNAAITYLGSLIEGLSNEAKYLLVAGAVTGGGLTVIANAPNPAGLAIVRRGFSDKSVSALGLLASAILPTATACVAFVLL
ncbi:putative Na+/H+ antiporter [Paraburkholderia fungorum]|uniref:putative Na+/H+ antiporter n=1 Tax=Paraburkholderia fungorum TaxID=134537 RepID=UPI0038BCE855